MCYDDGTDRVHVVGSRGVTDFVLPAENPTFEESGRTLVCETFDNRRREKVRLLGPFSSAPLSLQTLKKLKHC